MKQINLDEIISNYNPDLKTDYSVVFYSNIKDAMLDFGKQLLELASENAEVAAEFNGYEDYTTVDKKSITDTINQVK